MFRVEVIFHLRLVRVAVTDGGAPCGPRLVKNPAGEHGRGLAVVTGLSLQVGQCGDEHGRVVWADIPWDGPVPGPSLDHDATARADDNPSELARRFGVPVWFGRCTQRWWALARDELVTAPSAQELASELARTTAQPVGAGWEPDGQQCAVAADWGERPGGSPC